MMLLPTFLPPHLPPSFIQHDKSLAVYLLPYVLIAVLKLGSSELQNMVSWHAF